MASFTTDTEPKFDKLLNFRDVGSSVKIDNDQHRLQTGRLFRSARPDEVTSTDREKLVKNYGIKTVLDLRTTTEFIEASKRYSQSAALAQPVIVPSSDSTLARPMHIHGLNYKEININGKGFERHLVWQLKYSSLAKLVGLMVTGYRLQAISILGREVLQPRGLIGLGIDTLDHSGPEMKEVFDLLAREDSWPVLVHCTQGKDRTGLVVILVLLLCGVDTNSISLDYIKSDSELQSELPQRMKEISSIGLDESFAQCPPDFVPSIEQHIIRKYGSIQQYLKSIGVHIEQQQKIQSILLRKR